MNRLRSTISFLGVCGMLTTGAFAQEPLEDDGSTAVGSNRIVRLGEILVVGDSVTRNLLASPTVESEALDIASSTVDEEAIRLRNAGTLAEALDLSTGVFTEDRGRKEKQLSSFRGQIYPYPDFAINGVWQRSFWEVPAFFPAAAIDRVEVLRSGGAILVGPNSGLVGAVNIVPRRFDVPTTLLDVQGGSYGTFRSSIVHGDRQPKGDYTVGASHYATSGPDDANAGEQFSSLFGTGSWDPASDVHVELTSFILNGERELRFIEDPGMKSLQNRTEEYSPYTSYGGILRTLVSHDDDASTAFDLGGVLRDGDFHRQDSGKPEAVNRERDWEANVGVLHARKLAEANTLRLGLQYNHWVCPDGKRHFVGSRMDVHTLSGVIVDEHQWDRLTLDGGLRVTRSWYRDYTESTFNVAGDSLSARAIDHEWADPAIIGTLGGKYRLASRVSLYAHAAVGTVDVPPGAVPETGDSLDRESRLILDGGTRFEAPGAGTLKAGLFATLRRDAILLSTTQLTEDGDTFNAYANSDMRHYGLELEGRTIRLFDTVALFGNATAMNSTRSRDDDWVRYRELPQVIAGAGVNAVFGRFDVNLYGKYVSSFENRRFSQDGEYHDLGSFVDVSLTMGLTLGRKGRTRLYAALENLLDDEYSTVVGYPDFGFQAFVGLQHTL